MGILLQPVSSVTSGIVSEGFPQRRGLESQCLATNPWGEDNTIGYLRVVPNGIPPNTRDRE